MDEGRGFELRAGEWAELGFIGCQLPLEQELRHTSARTTAAVEPFIAQGQAWLSNLSTERWMG